MEKLLVINKRTINDIRKEENVKALKKEIGFEKLEELLYKAAEDDTLSEVNKDFEIDLEKARNMKYTEYLRNKLTRKQRVFCDYWIRTGDFRQALKAAKYSVKSYSKKSPGTIINNIHMKRYIKEVMDAMDKESVAKAEEVCEYLTSVMRGELEEEENMNEFLQGGGSEIRKVAKQVTPKDRTKAAELLGKHLGIFDTKMPTQEIAVRIVDDVIK